MSQAGKPLRFLGVVLGGWAVLRLGAVTLPVLWEAEEPMMASTEVSGRQRTPSLPASIVGPPEIPSREFSAREILRLRLPLLPQMTKASPADISPAELAAMLPLARSPVAPRVASSVASPVPAPSPVARAQPSPASPSETRAEVSIAPVSRNSPWSFTAWALWRRDSANGLAQAPLLGGSQGGVRVDYRLWNAGSRSLSLYGRATRALEQPHAEEAALGISLRPVEGLPVSLLAERRQRLGTGGRSAFAFMAAGGIGPEDIAPRLEIEGYAQAGVVVLPGSDTFADGRLSLDYRMTRKGTGPDLAVGVAVSGGAQTGASRLDIGPEVRLRLPVAGGHLRLSVEWRERIAGAARPSSGPAAALVADF